jgi:class 3 adenylate cyclase
VGPALVYRFVGARQAVACGREILARLVEFREAHPDLPLAARLGAHTGLVLQAEGQVRGRDAALAAALMVTAPPDGLHVSAATYEVLDAPDQARFEHLGRKRLKGVPEPLDIWRLKPAAPEPES